jgi:pimeloyl-ACP methyl ester carboxylesterase
VLVNGYSVGYLQGADLRWTVTEFRVPLRFLKFPGVAFGGGRPTPETNRIEIRIDTSSTVVEPTWCVAADWAAIEGNFWYPFVLVPGMGGNAQHYDVFGFAAPLEEQGIPHVKVPLPRGGVRVKAPVAALAAKQLTDRLGLDHAHYIGHSMGGRVLLELAATAAGSGAIPAPLSMITVDSPHLGSSFATLLLLGSNPRVRTDNPNLSSRIAPFYALFTRANAETPELTPRAAEAQNRAWLGRIPQTATRSGLSSRIWWAVVSDGNSNNRIDGDEALGILDPFYPGAESVVTSMWRNVGNIADYYVERATVTYPDGALEYELVLRERRNLAFETNTVIVTERSARGLPTDHYRLPTRLGRNHASILDRMLLADLVRGILPYANEW